MTQYPNYHHLHHMPRRRNSKPYYEHVLPIKRSSPFFPWLEHFFVRSWWVFLFIAVSFWFYYSSNQDKQPEYQELTSQLQSLEQKKLEVIEQQADFHAQIASQNDHAWIELSLMKELGLVPEGYTKVYFESPPPKPSSENE